MVKNGGLYFPGAIIFEIVWVYCPKHAGKDYAL